MSKLRELIGEPILLPLEVIHRIFTSTFDSTAPWHTRHEWLHLRLINSSLKTVVDRRLFEHQRVVLSQELERENYHLINLLLAASPAIRHYHQTTVIELHFDETEQSWRNIPSFFLCIIIPLRNVLVNLEVHTTILPDYHWTLREQTFLFSEFTPMLPDTLQRFTLNGATSCVLPSIAGIHTIPILPPTATAVFIRPFHHTPKKTVDFDREWHFESLAIGKLESTVGEFGLRHYQVWHPRLFEFSLDTYMGTSTTLEIHPTGSDYLDTLWILKAGLTQPDFIGSVEIVRLVKYTPKYIVETVSFAKWLLYHYEMTAPHVDFQFPQSVADAFHTSPHRTI